MRGTRACLTFIVAGSRARTPPRSYARWGFRLLLEAEGRQTGSTGAGPVQRASLTLLNPQSTSTHSQSQPFRQTGAPRLAFQPNLLHIPIVRLRVGAVGRRSSLRADWMGTFQRKRRRYSQGGRGELSGALARGQRPTPGVARWFGGQPGTCVQGLRGETEPAVSWGTYRGRLQPVERGGTCSYCCT